MSTKKTNAKPKTAMSPPAAPPTSNRNVMQVAGDPAKKERLLADLTSEGLYTNAVLMKTFSVNIAGEIGITEAVHSLRASLADVNRGDLRAVETMLLGQAAALNAMFAELARRAGANMGQYMDPTEKYMRLALKAQGQCRATLETLAAIKNPPLVFARQANINNGGQQQVNNGVASEQSGTSPNDQPATAQPRPSEGAGSTPALGEAIGLGHGAVPTRLPTSQVHEARRGECSAVEAKSR